MPRDAALSPGIHFARVREDIVVLDVAADRYSCLVGAAAWLTPTAPGWIRAGRDVIAELETVGLVGPDAPSRSRKPLLAPSAELPVDPAPGPLLQIRTAVATLAATAAFRNQPLATLVEIGPWRLKPDPVRIARRTGAYRAVLPLLPFEGLCLQRAWQLRRVLAADGLEVDWIFGVKTWPFFAHCWLQVGDQVVGDRLERVRAFTPIAAF